MATYSWIGNTTGDWNDANNWTGPEGPDVGVPGAGDTADIVGATVSTDGNTVASVVGGNGGPGPTTLEGMLTVTGTMSAMIISDGDFTAAEAYEVELMGGTLNAGTFNGSDVFGGTLEVTDLVGGFMQGGSVTATEVVAGSTLSPLLWTFITGGSFSAGQVVYASASVQVGSLLDVENGASATVGSATIGAASGIGAGAGGIGGGTPGTISGGLLTINGNLVLNGGEASARNGGSGGNGGTVTVGGSIDAASGDLLVGGTSYLHGGGPLTDDAPGVLKDAGSLVLGQGGTAGLFVEAAGTVSIGTDLAAGVGAGDLGQISLSTAGTLEVGSGLTLGEQGKGKLAAFGGSVTVGGSLLLGAGTLGSGTMSLFESVALNVSGDVIAGDSATGSGTITINDSTLMVGTDLIVGRNGFGSLDLSNHASLTVEGTLQLGSATGNGTITDSGGDPHFQALALNNGIANVGPGAANAWFVNLGTAQNIDVAGVAGGNATLNLPQTGTVVEGSGTITIGGAGTGVLNLAADALFDAAVNDITVGDEDTGNGTVTVNGDGALMEAGNLTVGDHGAGLLTVSGRGSLAVADTLAIGDNNAQTIAASVTITDSGSGVSAAALSVGGTGYGTLLVAGGTLSVSGDGGVGADSGGNGTMTVNVGSVDVSGTLTVGDSGNGLADVNQAGSLAADSLEIGNKAGGKGEVDVNATGTLSGNDISVGSAGKGTLKITGAEANTTGDVDIAEEVKGSVQSVTEDQESTWTVGGNFTDAAAGIASATIKGGSLLSVNGDVVVGDQAGSGGVLTVSGSLAVAGNTIGSEINFAGALKVGNAGFGSLTVQQGATVAAANGGTGEIDVAVAAGENSTLTVAGAGSVLDGKTLAVGGSPGAAGGVGRLSVTSGGRVQVAAAKIWAGGSVTLGGGTLEVQGAVSGAGTISMDPSALILDAPDLASVAVAGFSPGDSIDLVGVDPSSVSYADGTLSFGGGSFSLGVTGGAVHAAKSADGTTITACFCAGTRILTGDGEVTVEALETGVQIVSIVHGQLLPVRWRASQRSRTAAVRIAAGALGENVPHRDLWLSPDHALFVDGVLVPVRYLINGANVTKELSADITYYHVQLSEHAVLLADGAPCESYLDTGNRASFDRMGDVPSSYHHYPHPRVFPR
jgi:T5SS/PEP-CTERM-associated repeat protein